MTDFPLDTLIDGVPFDVYLGDPADTPSMTNSDGKAILHSSPREVWENNRRLNKNWEPGKSDNKFELGSVFHEHIMLTGDPYVIVKANDWRTNAAKEARADALKRGKTPILKGHYDTVIAMAKSFAEQCKDISAGEGVSLWDMIARAKREQTIIFKDQAVLCRARPDLYDVETNTIIHVKTTAVDINPWNADRQAANMDWQFMLAHYEAAGAAVFGSLPRQLVVIAKVAPPHLVLPLEFGPATLSLGRKERTLALTKWRACVSTNTWPGFPSKVIKADIPEWKERQILEREVEEEDAKSAGKDLLAQSILWQAPFDWQPPARGKVNENSDVIEEGSS